MERSLVTTDRMVMMRSIGYKWDKKNKKNNGIPPDFRSGVHLIIPRSATGSVQSLSGRAIAYLWRFASILSTCLLVFQHTKHQIQPECGEWAGWRGTGRPNPSRETKFWGANGDRDISIFRVQLTTSRIDNFTRLINTRAVCDDHTCVHTYILPRVRRPGPVVLNVVIIMCASLFPHLSESIGDGESFWYFLCNVPGMQYNLALFKLTLLNEEYNSGRARSGWSQSTPEISPAAFRPRRDQALRKWSEGKGPRGAARVGGTQIVWPDQLASHPMAFTVQLQLNHAPSRSYQR